MKIDCEVIRDLLPLYADEACSETSRGIVEEHLQECDACREQLRMLKQTEIDDCLQNEKALVIRDGARRFKRQSAAVGSAVSGFFMIPILAYLVINIYSRSPLSVFFIVLASLLVAASLILVPLAVPENKAFWTFCSFCVSLVILLAVTCLYSHGTWFWIASSAAVFGLTVVFLPFLIRKKPLKELIGRSNPVLVVLAMDAVLFANMMNMIRRHGRVSRYSLLITVIVIIIIAMVIAELIRKRGNTEEME